MGSMKYTHCLECKQEFSNLNVFTLDGARETQISGMCENCFDRLFEDCEEEEE